MPAEQKGSVYATKTGYGVRWLEQGQRRHQSGFKSRTDARNYFRDSIAPRLRGDSTIDPRRTTFREFVDHYLEAHTVGRQASTIKTLQERLKRPVAIFGDVTLHDLERRTVEIAKWRGTLPEGSRYGITQAMLQTIDAAIRWNVMITNPVRAAGRNTQPKREEIQPFTQDELRKLAGELGQHAPMIVFAVETGMRPSEFLALEWRDVNRSEGIAVVERSYSRGLLKAFGKTARSRRAVPLSAVALEALAAITRRIDTPLVFPNIQAGHINLHNFRARDWIPAIDAAGIPSRRIYDLRHTFASEALAAGISVYDLARYMGTSVRMIDLTYGHLAKGSEAAARAKLDARSSVLASIWREANA